MRYLPTKCLMLASGLRKCERLTHKMFEAGVGSEEVGQRLHLGVTQQGETVQLDDVVDSQGRCVLDLPTITKGQCDSVQGRVLGDGGGWWGGADVNNFHTLLRCIPTYSQHLDHDPSPIHPDEV